MKSNKLVIQSLCRLVPVSAWFLSPLMLALAISFSCFADAGLDLAELRRQHEAGLSEYFRSSFELTDEQDEKLLFVGGTDSALIEFSNDQGKRVYCIAETGEYRLLEPNTAAEWIVTEFTQIPKPLGKIEAATRFLDIRLEPYFGPFCYYETPIVSFLSDPTLKQTGHERRTDPALGRIHRVHWTWKSPNGKNWFGYFDLLLDRHWIVQKYARTGNPESGYLVTEFQFDPAGQSCIPTASIHYIDPVGGEREVRDEHSYRVISSTPANADRFKLSHYGLSDAIGQPASKSTRFLFLLGSALLALAVYFLAGRKAKSQSLG